MRMIIVTKGRMRCRLSSYSHAPLVNNETDDKDVVQQLRRTSNNTNTSSVPNRTPSPTGPPIDASQFTPESFDIIRTVGTGKICFFFE